MDHKIVVQNLYKIFGNHPRKGVKLLKQGYTKDQILEKTGLGVGIADVSFHVDEGEILVIMGLSGSGKSTLVRCLNRLIEPTEGKILLEGTDITSLNKEELRQLRQKRFGMVFQHFALFPHRSVIRNIEYGLEVQKVPSSKRRERAMKALEQVGLKGWEDSYPDQLSGGMQQRVGLARALALDPDIMLMDEAFSALDPLIRRDMQDELIKLQEKMHKTIIFISHDLDEALKLGDRIILMKDGRIVQEGTAESILSNPADDYVAKFVEDVDISKVVTAESIMKNPGVVASYAHDGPRAALRKMRQAGLSSIYVQHKGRLMGIVRAEDASAALKAGEKDLKNIIVTDIQKVSPETPAYELFPLLAESSPLAVVDSEEHLMGVIIKGSLLAALAEGVQTNGNDLDAGDTGRQSN
ncbi:MAG: quaternary amine ABC transporter ATP-binding protein [Desulfomonilia bacterium]|uniref:Glycine betaine transporter subunit ATP-binding compoent of ABC superfamily n=1 Tax=anaerobic digester metagenome TaxID=1263854 RepID=A0A485M0Q4_9ZZZZ|nr:glycine betaine/L-proline ABC transporter ATP-binding protein [Pseudomonadota bacterium]HON37546.1 glycine betaine/L-proline ABC transporter ATP-binding protein [Deltaproteobacteria bacterium]HRS55054.1 glycine betaine/L-proline ABC transporter ATP-binding protein [Desulfomonilia bacterium]HPD20771.1 glycine betaine/L-proline ABC transporter ATP-binding protein [Deltaproteobacteria bacterium]HPX18571.1 glycine betaine/L-proline ABC transporter ATP-binding protein [Deltaproteobacteria bacteri